MLKRCPTPGKKAYDTESEARVGLRNVKAGGNSWVKPNRVYECPCGKWHLSKAARRKGQAT